MKELLNKLFSRQGGTAQVAKDRLQIIMTHERGAGRGPEFLSALQKELLEVVRRHLAQDLPEVQVSLRHEDGVEVLALDVALSGKP